MIKKKICFLGYNRAQTKLIEIIEERGCKVHETTDKVDDFSLYDSVISFGYPHIISSNSLKTLSRPAINLHISYLPYNRGAHPNFWSWIDETPAGVTIHEIDAGIDTGSICFQKQVVFNDHMITFADTYSQLIKEVENLFIENIDDLLEGTYQATPQPDSGTYHNTCDLPEWVDNWEMPIEEAKQQFSKSK